MPSESDEKLLGSSETELTRLSKVGPACQELQHRHIAQGSSMLGSFDPKQENSGSSVNVPVFDDRLERLSTAADPYAASELTNLRKASKTGNSDTR